MNIKKRLIISNTLIVVIPLIITTIIATLFIFFSSKVLDKELSYNSFRNSTLVRAELFNIGNNIPKESMHTLESEDLERYLSEKLLSLNGKYIVTKEDKVIYFPKDMSKFDVEKVIDKAESKGIERRVEINNASYILEDAEFYLKDGAKGRVVLLAPIGKEGDLFKKFLILIGIVFILSFIGVNIIMSYQFSKTILKPISQLKKATSEIKSGNLEQEIIEDGDKEIKELCYNFEVMRIQLKDSINEKMKYDDNRKILVSSISHDLKTPITSIKGYVEGILDGVANTPEKIETYLKTIYSKAEHVDHMIDDLLLYSKLDLKQLPFNFERTDIVEYFSYCIDETKHEFTKSNIEIKFINDLKQSRFVMIDRERMRRVIINILDNSRKYMGKKEGEVTINLRETNSSIIAEIRDNGVGIDSDDINKMFDRFYRADSSRGGVKGSGLGLAISKQIVEGHKGRIWAINHKGDGLSILISLTKVRV